MKTALLSFTFTAIVATSTYASTAENIRYCQNAGGIPRTMQLMLSAGPTGFMPSGDPRLMCLFFNKAADRLEVVAANTLGSKNPSLAATAYRNAPIINIPQNTPRYDVYYCQHLGGTATIGEGLPGAYSHSAASNQFPMCIFPDGSAIDTWSLAYKRFENNPAIDLSDKFNSAPLNIPAAMLWGPGQYNQNSSK